MKKFIKEFLSYSKSERNGTIILLACLIAILFLYTFLDSFIIKEQADFSSFQKEIDAFLTDQNSSERSNKENPLELFYFDPNNLSEEKWVQLGISEKTIRVIKNYEKKGGRFYKKENLKKIYGLREKDYQRLKPYIQINVGHDKNNYVKSTKKQKKSPVIIDINIADSVSWTQIKGIGPVFAARIIKYHDLLGGFVNKEQLLEVYGIDDMKYEQMEPYITLSTPAVRKININTAGIYELKKHPYISKKIATTIVNYRDQHKEFSTVQAIKNIHIINEALYNKLTPYLTVK